MAKWKKNYTSLYFYTIRLYTLGHLVYSDVDNFMDHTALIFIITLK